MMRTHYRQPINWTAESLAETKKEIEGWALLFSQDANVRHALSEPAPSPDVLDALCDDLNLPAALAILRRQMNSKKSSDRLSFARNVGFLGLLKADSIGAYIPGVTAEGPISTTVLFSNAKRAEDLKIAIANGDIEAQSLIVTQIQQSNLSVRIEGGAVVLRASSDGALEGSDDRIGNLIAARLEARKRKDFAESDRIRDELAAMGIQLKDSRNKETGEIETTWEVKR